MVRAGSGVFEMKIRFLKPYLSFLASVNDVRDIEQTAAENLINRGVAELVTETEKTIVVKKRGRPAIKK